MKYHGERKGPGPKHTQLYPTGGIGKYRRLLIQMTDEELEEAINNPANPPHYIRAAIKERDWRRKLDTGKE